VRECGERELVLRCAARPYPFEILGMQPGDSLDDVMAALATRSEETRTRESNVISVRSPDGRTFEFTYERFRQIGGLTFNERMAEVDFAESVTASLSSVVMDQRPVSIGRSMRLPTDQLPTAQALQAQMEEAYGPPSQVETSQGNVTIRYAWSDEGFVPDLAGQATRDITVTSNNREIVVPYQPCLRTAGLDYDTDPEYSFGYPCTKELMPGCVAVFTISHSTKPGTAAISFSIVDYDLARQHRAELDRQIVEALTGEEVVAPSELDL
jgi:hypothetical protein